MIETQGKEVKGRTVLKSKNAEGRVCETAAFIEQGRVGRLLPAGLSSPSLCIALHRSPAL